MTKVKKKISFEGQNIYVGLDVHKKQWTCIFRFKLGQPFRQNYATKFASN